jgi:hypothetical protein
MNTIYKNETVVIFACILIISTGYCIFLLYHKTSELYKNYQTYQNNNEYFGSRDRGNDSKRNKMIRIYKGDEILDPDEDPDDENDDPDSTRGRDPDS